MSSYRLEVRVPRADSGDGVHHGTAWPITHDIVVTAFHVVADEEERRTQWISEMVDAEYFLIWENEAVKLEPVAADRHSDVALLRRKPPAANADPAVWQPLPIGEWGAARGASWTAPSHAAVAGQDTQTLSGGITRFTPDSGDRAFELYIEQGSAVSWEGASGSPVCVGGRAVGIVTKEVGGASTLWAAEAESALRLLRVHRATHLFDACVAIASKQPPERLRALQWAGQTEQFSDAEDLSRAIVIRAAHLGANGLIALLGGMRQDDEVWSLKHEIARVAVTSERAGWPRSLSTPDSAWERHSEWEPPPTLMKAWRRFLQREPWHEQLRDVLRRAVSALKSTNADQMLVGQLETVNTIRTYGTLRVELTQLVERVLRRRTRSVPSSRDRVPSPESTLDRQRALTGLRDLLDPTSPRGRCFFLMGSSGSGKTHFLDAIVESEPETPSSPLVLPVIISGSEALGKTAVEKAISSALQAATGRAFSNLQEFQDALDGQARSRAVFLKRAEVNLPQLMGGPRLVIALDDLHRIMRNGAQSERLSGILRELIDDSTIQPRVYWLLTLQDTLYDLIPNPAHLPSFWEEYGTVGEYGNHVRRGDDDSTLIPAKGGWVDLDRINAADEVGLEILNDGLGDESLSNALTALHERGREPGLRQYLQLPWFAWTVYGLDKGESARAIQTGDFHYIGIVKELRSARIDKLDASQEERLRTQRYMRVSAAALMPSNGSRWRNERLSADAAGIAAAAGFTFDAAEFQVRLDKLISANLLKRVVDELRERLEISLEMIWSYEGAQHLLQLLLAPDQATMTATLEDALRSDEPDAFRLREGATEFLLMLVDRDHPAFLGDLMRFVLGSSVLARHAIWFAAPKASDEFQRMLCSSHPATSPEHTSPEGRRLLFARLMFVERASPEVLSPKARLTFMQADYEALYKHGFASYYLAVALDVLKEVRDAQTLTDCMLALRGCERAGTSLAEQVAEVATDRLFAIELGRLAAAPDGTLTANALARMLIYLKASLEHARADYATLQAKAAVGADAVAAQKLAAAPAASYDQRWRRQFFREWVLRAFSERLVRQMGPTRTFHFLRSNLWFSRSSVGRPVIREMVREANIAIGRYFHSRGHLLDEAKDEGREFLELLSHLVGEGATSDDRETAFHLLRHTRPTYGEYDVQISEQLLPFLTALSRDEALRRNGSFVGLYHKNIGPLPFDRAESGTRGRQGTRTARSKPKEWSDVRAPRRRKRR